MIPFVLFAQSALPAAHKLPKSIAFNGGNVDFRAISTGKAGKMLEKAGAEKENSLTLGIRGDWYTEFDDVHGVGFDLHFRNGMMGIYYTSGTIDTMATFWGYQGYDSLTDIVYLTSQQGKIYHSLWWLADGSVAVICDVPQLSPTRKWLVAASDFTESREQKSQFELYQFAAPPMPVLLELESPVDGFAFMGWVGKNSGILRLRWDGGEGIDSRHYVVKIKEN